jgi:tocopherol O-methyltransferase
MKYFTKNDIEDYYNQTEVHYRMFWNLNSAKGLHYGIWDKSTKSLDEAILNTNDSLMKLGEIKPSDKILDCGCGIGGSAIYLARKIGCQVSGITLSAKQATKATLLAEKEGVSQLVSFSQKDYLASGYTDNAFDIIWAIESFGSSPDKSLFFNEMNRILKPGGKILFADTFKPYSYDIERDANMQIMLNGWAISDILSVEELKAVAEANNFKISAMSDVTKEIRKSVIKIYRAALLGMIGTKLYNLFRKASYFSRIHYKTGIAQKKTYYSGRWGYYLVVCTNQK